MRGFLKPFTNKIIIEALFEVTNSLFVLEANKI
jgi:hypothetical protein